MDAKSNGFAAASEASEKTRVGPRRLLALTRPALRLVWSASPRETVDLVLLQTLSGLMLPAQLLAGKWALDAVLEASRAGAAMDAALPEIAIALAAMTIGQLLASAARRGSGCFPR